MIRASKHSDVGGRQENEDSCSILKNSKYVCAMVADGLGGHGGGATASQTAITVIGQHVSEDDSFAPEMLHDWFQDANEEIVKLQTNACKMKTTMVMLCVNEKKAFWAHVGDTRLYHFTDGKITDITFDHSVSQMAVLSGEIEQKDIRHHVDRNKLLRALGKADEIRVETSKICDVSQGQHTFLLCTDGFWEYVLEEEMEETLQQANDPKEWLQAMHHILEERVDGNNDNNTAVALSVIHEA